MAVILWGVLMNTEWDIWVYVTFLMFRGNKFNLNVQFVLSYHNSL